MYLRLTNEGIPIAHATIPPTKTYVLKQWQIRHLRTTHNIVASQVDSGSMELPLVQEIQGHLEHVTFSSAGMKYKNGMPSKPFSCHLHRPNISARYLIAHLRCSGSRLSSSLLSSSEPFDRRKNPRKDPYVLGN